VRITNFCRVTNLSF